MGEYKSKEETRQFYAALRRARRISERIRERMLDCKLIESDNKDEGIAVVPIKETCLASRRQLVRRTAR